MFIMIWLLTGFAMVVLSSAIKGVPSELLEAARIDGANEIHIFFRVIVPYIRGTIITITTTVIIMVLKVFDIVFVMTSGQFETQVIANRMFQEMFTFRNAGRASALAIILLIAVTPVMIYNVRNMRAGRS
jgi:alpha-glucoside transport system permease protein